MVQNSRVRKRTLAACLAIIFSATLVSFASISPANAGVDTTVPGHSGSRVDADNDGFPDAGQVVSGHYNETYSDADGDCEVRVNYRGTYEDNAYLDSGWIQNHYRCVASDGSTTTYNYLMVHETDPRYTGNPGWALWGTWEYHVLTEGGSGNVIRPANHVS